MRVRRTAFRLVILTAGCLVFHLVLAEALALWMPARQTINYSSTRTDASQHPTHEFCTPSEHIEPARGRLEVLERSQEITGALERLPPSPEYFLVDREWTLYAGIGASIERVDVLTEWVERQESGLIGLRSLGGKLWVFSSGWPMPCLEGTRSIDLDIRPNPVYTNAVDPPPWLHSRDTIGFARPLLLRPLWKGLATNTVATAAAIWLLLSFCGVARHHLRRRRNRCPRCNYDRKGLSAETPCPECGLPIR